MNPVSLEYLVGLKDIHTWRSGKITITPLSERDPAGHRKDNFRASFQEWLESPPDIENTWLESEAGAVSSVILRFVGLHELGHLILAT